MKPFNYSQYEPQYGETEKQYLTDLIDSGSWLADFKKTEEFEQRIRLSTEVNYVHAVNNGTVAISLALLASGLKPNDLVVVPNLTMIATATAVEFIGCKVVLCDVDPTGCLDLNKLKELITLKPKAVIYVTLNGRSNEKSLLEIRDICKDEKILLIKDDAQSLGSLTETGNCLQNKKYADFHTLSFSPHKIVSCGQGGAVLTDNPEYADNIARLKDFGRLAGGADIHDHFGINSKFTEMQAVIGIAQINRLNDRIFTKKRIYKDYYDYLNNAEQDSIQMYSPGLYTPWFVDIYFKDMKQRDVVSSYLSSLGIGNRKLYPALNTQAIYESSSVNFEMSNHISSRGLWLPSSFTLTSKDIENICEKIVEGLNQ